MYPLEFCWQEGVFLITSPSLTEKLSILVVFTGRHGGVSHVPYDTFNLAFRIGDDPSAVLANRRKLCSILGLKAQSLTSAEQVHSSSLAIVNLRDKDTGILEDSFPGVDGLVTKVTGIPLILFFADCVPLALIHPQSRAVAMVHAGWRGTLENIASKAVDVLENISGAKAEEMLAFIGPAIGPCCYQVKPKIIQLFQKKFGSYGIFPNNKLDLSEINSKQLSHRGIPGKSIEIAGVCTSCQYKDFFSYRASQGKTGRQAGLVVLL